MLPNGSVPAAGASGESGRRTNEDRGRKTEDESPPHPASPAVGRGENAWGGGRVRSVEAESADKNVCPTCRIA